MITSEQMLDAYASVGLPLMYRHWSFGKRFAYHETLYRKGLAGLAYEIVINSNPVICYIMEENSMTMQTLVMRMPRSATTISSRTTTCSGSGPMPGASSIISPSRATTSQSARRNTAWTRSSGCSTRPTR